MFAHFATASLGATDVQTVRTIFRSWIGRRAAAPDGVDGGIVVPGARRFQISVCVASIIYWEVRRRITVAAAAMNY